MNKMAFVFPGQGSQFVGMGAELAKKYHPAAKVYENSDQILGYSLSRICFDGPPEILNQTKYTQAAVFTTSIAMLRVIDEMGIRAEVVTGHSLGEYSALVAAGVLNFEDALTIVQKRAELMDDVAGAGRGGMAAIIGLEKKVVEEICDTVTKGFVKPANYNAPAQVVISGDNSGLEEACDLARKAGAKRTIRLPLSGPFHTPLMERAQIELGLFLKRFQFFAPHTRFVTTVTGCYLSDPEAIKMNLAEQLCAPVRWDDTVKNLFADGYRIFVEVGPGQVLSGLIKRIVSGVQVLNVENGHSLENMLAQLRGTV